MKLDYNIKELIKKYAALIETNKFDQLYETLAKSAQESAFIPDITEVFESAGINPLDYMTYIESGMYYQSQLTEINIPNNIRSIQRKAFEAAYINKIVMSDSVKTIGHRCFSDCRDLTHITLSNRIEVIPNLCFDYCSALSTIKLPDRCVVIGYGAFANCQNLRNIDFNNSLDKIEKRAFQGAGLRVLEFPRSLKLIDDSAFSCCDQLEKVVIPGNTIIKNDCFSNCDQLREVALGKDVELVDGFNFSDCGNLEIITYLGTKDQFMSKNLPKTWFGGSSIEVVRCTDGDIEI